MKHFGLASFSLLLCGVLAGSVRADSSKSDTKFPAAEIAKAMVAAEESDPNAEYPDEGFIDWDPYIDPDFSRSWLYTEVPSEVLDKLELNKDQHDQTLFPNSPKRQ